MEETMEQVAATPAKKKIDIKKRFSASDLR